MKPYFPSSILMVQRLRSQQWPTPLVLAFMPSIPVDLSHPAYFSFSISFTVELIFPWGYLFGFFPICLRCWLCSIHQHYWAHMSTSTLLSLQGPCWGQEPGDRSFPSPVWGEAGVGRQGCEKQCLAAWSTGSPVLAGCGTWASFPFPRLSFLICETKRLD